MSVPRERHGHPLTHFWGRRQRATEVLTARLDRPTDGGVEQLTDGLLGGVIEAVRPARPAGHGAAWEACRAEHDRIKVWLDKGLNLTKVEDLRARRTEPREVFVARVPRLARAWAAMTACSAWPRSQQQGGRGSGGEVQADAELVGRQRRDHDHERGG
jgi:hypothetical protein